MSAQKRTIVHVLLGVILLLAGSFVAFDWMIFFYGIQTIYAGVAKPIVSCICLILVLLIGRDGIDRRDTALLLLAFLCIVPTDILMSVVALSPDVTVSSPQFMAGGVLSIVAHILLLIRHGRGFPYLGRSRESSRGLLGFFWLPSLILVIYLAALIPLIRPMGRVGHLVIGPIYSGIVAMSMWVAWETVRYRLYPKPNAWMIGTGITCWFVTEIVGEIYNIQIGTISQIMFNFVWIFYGTCIVCLALSGYRWNNKSGELGGAEVE